MKLSSWARIQALQQEGSGIRWVLWFRTVSVILIWLSLLTVLASPLLLKLLPIFQQAVSQKQRADSPLGRSLLSLIPKADPPIASGDLQAIASPTCGTEFDASVSLLSETVLPQLKAYLSAVPQPNIHPRARLAKVPVMMYHDVLPEKEVFFDLTPEEFEADLQRIQQSGLTPVSLDHLVNHLKTGIPLPPKPIVLTFDDGYSGHYQYVYPLLKKYGYPGTFAIYTSKVGKKLGRSSLTWTQLEEMAKDPLVTIASHTLTHPDLTQQSGDLLDQEIIASKQILEKALNLPIHHFVYPEGKFDKRVEAIVQKAGYTSALIMRNDDGKFAGESDSLLTLERFGFSELDEAIAQASGGSPLPSWSDRLDLQAPVEVRRETLEDIPFIFASGGRPITIHSDKRYRINEILSHSNAVAAVGGSFFSLESLETNVIIGPVLSQNTQKFIPGSPGENLKLKDRPLVLINPERIKFLPFDPPQHNTLESFQAELPGVTDGFVAAGWLVRDSLPQPASAFGQLYGFDFERDRAFWGIDHQGRPTVGISTVGVDSVRLGKLLAQAGFRDVIMVDSGASTDLVYQGQSLGVFEPRPLPHIVGLVPPMTVTGCR